jgi:hypothetical protein
VWNIACCLLRLTSWCGDMLRTVLWFFCVSISWLLIVSYVWNTFHCLYCLDLHVKLTFSTGTQGLGDRPPKHLMASNECGFSVNIWCCPSFSGTRPEGSVQDYYNSFTVEECRYEIRLIMTEEGSISYLALPMWNTVFRGMSHFGRTFLRLIYTYVTKHTHIQSWQS